MQKELFDQGLNKTEKFNEDHWKGMPEYYNIVEPEPEITATFKFRNEKDYEHFKETVKKHLYDGEKCFDGMQRKGKYQAWYPLKEKESKYRYYDENSAKNPRFSIYIVSKGRWERNPTRECLEKMKIPYRMIVEESQYDDYAKYMDKENLLILPEKYKKEYDTFWKDEDKRTGPGPARNFAWDHSISEGHDWHWVMDDNIESFVRLNKNRKVECTSGTIFYVCEQYVLRYTNIGQAGLNYTIFCPSSDSRPVVKFNTRIYSCLLIRNDIPFRWRGRYNEDTDLSLRIMKSGMCTVQFNAFLQSKRATQTMRGGNSEEFYDKEGTKNKSQMLVDMHPDVSKMSYKFNRWHHYVNYKPFEVNKPKLREDIHIQEEANEYGMILRERDDK
jgi:hypothetical protein